MIWFTRIMKNWFKIIWMRVIKDTVIVKIMDAFRFNFLEDLKSMISTLTRWNKLILSLKNKEILRKFK